jgi:hypothetical protein
MFGDYVADVSVFRTAYSEKSPRRLRDHVVKEFGIGKGLLISKAADVGSYGLNYLPQYILSEDQITAVGRGALDIINGQ